MDSFVNMFKQSAGQARESWLKLSLNQKVLAAGAALFLLSTLIFLVKQSGESKFEVLYTDLNQKDAAAIVEKLDEEKIRYQLMDNGSTIMVPTEVKYTTRLKLASVDLPQGEVGFELFQESNFGETQTDKKVKYREALQGELARTIQRLDNVQAAKVNIAIPEQSLFTDNEEPTKASVVVNTINGAALGSKEVRSIINLVANSVEGLDPENVVIVDQYGTLLSDGVVLSGEGNSTELLRMQMELQRAYESAKQTAIQTMLDKTLGKDNSVVRVNVELNFNSVQETSEKYSHDPDGPFIRSEQIIKESSTNSSETAGVPGTDTNIPQYQEVDTGSGSSSYDKSDETSNYEINKTETLTQYALGDVKYDYLTASVFVDNEGASKANLGETNEERAQKIRNIVAAACGLRENRSDENVSLDENISVEFIDFYTEPEPEPVTLSWLDKLMASPLLPYLFAGFALLLLTIIILATRKNREVLEGKPARNGFDATVGEEISMQELVEKALTPEEKERQKIKDEIENLIDKSPEAAAQVVKAWLLDDQR